MFPPTAFMCLFIKSCNHILLHHVHTALTLPAHSHMLSMKQLSMLMILDSVIKSIDSLLLFSRITLWAQLVASTSFLNHLFIPGLYTSHS